MAGVDDAGLRSSQVDPHQQAGDELALAGLLGERIIRQPRLLGQLDALPRLPIGCPMWDSSLAFSEERGEPCWTS